MANQGNLFSTRNEPATAVQPFPQQRQRQIPRWLLVMEIVLFVILRLYVGALVVLLPWRSIWTTNAWINTGPRSPASSHRAGCAVSSPASAC